MASSLPSEIDILVVGSGPTGLTAANLAATYGASVLIVDRNPAPLDLPRAVVIDDEGCRTVAAAGLGDPLKAIIRPADGARYFDEHGHVVGEVGPGPEEFGWRKRNYFHQPELEAVLRRGLLAHDQATLADGVEVLRFLQDPDGVTVDVTVGAETRSIWAKVMIAADGAHSPTRQALGFEFPGEAYAQDWIVLDLAHDPDDEAVSKFFCDPARPWVSIATPFGGRRYEFMLLPGETREDMLRPATLTRLLAPVRPLPPEDITRAVVYRFEARVAAHWGSGRVWLAGDAAHLTPPFAGQGMNAGLRDAHNLAWKAVRVAKHLSAPKILESYEAERREPARAMVRLAVAMGEVVMPVGPDKALLRNALMFGLQRFPEARDYIFGMRFKPRPAYSDGLFIGLDNADAPPASLVGTMPPNPAVATPTGTDRFDHLLGDGFALVAQDADSRAWLAAADLEAWPGSPKPIALSDDAGYADKQSFRPLRAHRDEIILLRPDRYVLGSFRPADADQFLTDLKSLLAN